MTDISNEPSASASSSASATQTTSGGETGATLAQPIGGSVKPQNRMVVVAPVLDTLFELYPKLFGARFLPLKLGVFHELLAAHPDRFERDTLKLALGVHTRSTRYLQCVAAGLQRHDLQGQPVEDVAPEHVFASMVELFVRRQGRTAEASPVKLRHQLMAAYERSGLTRQDYLLCIGTPPEALQTVLEEAMEQVDLQRARKIALQKSFAASGKSVQAFAEMLGMSVREVRAALPS